ncbi:MAG: FAD-binding oxidoreductase [Pseudomonadota bacterium]
MLKDAFNLTLVERKMVTPTILHMVFNKEDGQRLDYVPGQFVTFHFDLDGEHFLRSYSIASIPHQTQAIEIAVSPYPEGAGTTKLFAMQPGDNILTTGPFGRLVLRDPVEDPKRYVLVATGTGVTPYRTMLTSLSKRLQNMNLSVMVLLGIKSPAELLYGKDFRDFAAKHENFQFHEFYSREFPENMNAMQHQGYVQTAFNWLKLDPNNDVIYLCGNAGMIDEAFAKCIELGFETKKIRREKYISPRLLKRKV